MKVDQYVNRWNIAFILTQLLMIPLMAFGLGIKAILDVIEPLNIGRVIVGSLFLYIVLIILLMTRRMKTETRACPFCQSVKTEETLEFVVKRTWLEDLVITVDIPFQTSVLTYRRFKRVKEGEELLHCTICDSRYGVEFSRSEPVSHDEYVNDPNRREYFKEYPIDRMGWEGSWR